MQSEIPEDVMNAAKATISNGFIGVESVARAIMAERERCEAALSAAEPGKPAAEEYRHPEWIWYCESTTGPMVTFGRWAKNPQQKRYKLADIQPTEHDHPAPFVAVKALEWTQFTDRSLDLNADSIEGAYVIRPSAGNKFPVYLWVPGVPYDDARLKPFNDLEAAKSHAQTHHEALIRSALSAQVQDVAEGKELDRFELWFFHHLSDDQRTALFALAGYPTTGMNTHGKQKIALKHWFSRLPAAPAKQEGGE